MSEKHPIEGVMDTSMKNLKEIVDANTVIGEPITTSAGTVIIPVSKVSFGFASGGSDFATKHSSATPNFGGGSGAGVTLTPVAFLIAGVDGSVDLKIIAPEASNMIDKAIDIAPDIVDKIKNTITSVKEKRAEKKSAEKKSAEKKSAEKTSEE